MVISQYIRNWYYRYLNEVELKQSGVILIKPTVDKNDLILSLKLDKLKLGDAGRVQVVANNSEGDVGSAAKLAVKGEEYCCHLGVLCLIDSR